MRRNLLNAIACLTAPGAAWFIGPWCAQREARRLWREGRGSAALDLALGAMVAPLFLGFALLQMPQLWTYTLLSSAFHLWFLCWRQDSIKSQADLAVWAGPSTNESITTNVGKLREGGCPPMLPMGGAPSLPLPPRPLLQVVGNDGQNPGCRAPRPDSRCRLRFGPSGHPQRPGLTPTTQDV